MDKCFDAGWHCHHLKKSGATLKQVADELSYRDEAAMHSMGPDQVTFGWDDDLCIFTTDELSAIEVKWIELDKDAANA